MKEIRVRLPDDLYAEFMAIKRKSIVNGRKMTNGELAMVAIAMFVVAVQQEREVNQA